MQDVGVTERSRILWAVMLAFLLSLASTSRSQAKTILVFAPHPDDEALMASGIIYSALARGDTVKVVVMTNGDSASGGTAYGITREGESVTGMSILGLTEQNIIFLGYGDQTLIKLYNSGSPTAVFTSPAGQTQTYASRGLGGTDYHNFLNGVHGAYNQATLLGDVKAVLQNFKPDEIYTTNSWDAHPDHQGTLLFIAAAILALRRGGMNFAPMLFESIVHAPSDGYLNLRPDAWPRPPFAPLLPFSSPHGLNTTPLDWNQVMNFPVPISMQDPNPSTNLKEQAISAYKSQNHGDPNNWLFSFVKKNEFFWVYNYSTNLALNATVTDSSQAIAQPGTAAVNGVVDGYPGNFSQEWATVGQLNGAWIQLNWASPITASLVVLHDRPNTTDNVRAGTLSFSDGSSISVGALPNIGIGLPVTFSPKNLSWVRFTTNQAVGQNIGLSEIEVYGKAVGSAANYAPQIIHGPVANPSVVNSSDSSNLSVTGYDVDVDMLHYLWGVDSGNIVESGPTATFFPPAASANPVFTVTVTVSDGKGASVSNTAFIRANGPNTLALSPSSVPGGGSSQGTVTLLGPAPDTGAVVDLASSDISVATVPSSVTVPAHSTSVTFTVHTTAVSVTTPVTISASYGEQTQTAILSVTRIVPSLSLSPTAVLGGTSSQGTVTLNAAAPSTGAVVGLSSSNTSAATVPSSVTIPAGSTSKTFTVSTSSVAAPTSVTISASYGGNTATATLTVKPQTNAGSNVAFSASVTQSSQNVSTGQLGTKAIDGAIDGYPGDYTKEWATVGQLAGAWIQLGWSSPVSVSQVILYDRPNLTDNVKSGTLLFSDGTALSVGQLPNDAKTGYTVSFPAKTISWVKFTIGSAVGQNIGLAEFQVIAASSPGP